MQQSRVTVCAWCTSVGVDGTWPAERRPSLMSVERQRELTHGICPDCFATLAPAVPYPALAAHP